jgi:hypothetical protein
MLGLLKVKHQMTEENTCVFSSCVSVTILSYFLLAVPSPWGRNSRQTCDQLIISNNCIQSYVNKNN